MNARWFEPHFPFGSDDDLKAIIVENLKALDLEPEEHVFVKVENAVVTLTGSVFQRYKKLMASGVCWELSGVRNCKNLITLIEPPPTRVRVSGRKIELLPCEILV